MEASGQLHDPIASPWGTAPGTYFIRGLDAVTKRESPCPHRELNLGCPAHSSVTILTELIVIILIHK